VRSKSVGESRPTLALSGRAVTPAARRGRTINQGARGAHATRHHGPLERVVRPPAALCMRKAPQALSLRATSCEGLENSGPQAEARMSQAPMHLGIPSMGRGLGRSPTHGPSAQIARLCDSGMRRTLQMCAGTAGFRSLMRAGTFASTPCPYRIAASIPLSCEDAIAKRPRGPRRSRPKVPAERRTEGPKQVA
jgi:hypothetical protein